MAALSTITTPSRRGCSRVYQGSWKSTCRFWYCGPRMRGRASLIAIAAEQPQEEERYECRAGQVCERSVYDLPRSHETARGRPHFACYLSSIYWCVYHHLFTFNSKPSVDEQLCAILTQVLAIPISEDLPTPNSRKTCALSIWLIQSQRLPSEVLLPAKDRIAYALRRGIEGELGKEGKKGSANDGLKVHFPFSYIRYYIHE